MRQGFCATIQQMGKETKELNRLNALISLVDEPDNVLFEKVCEDLYNYGATALPFLQKAFDNAANEDLRTRFGFIIDELQQKDLFIYLSIWAITKSDDLLWAYLLVTRLHYRDMDIQAVMNSVNEIIQEVRMELNPALTLLEKVRVINHVLFEVRKFSVNHTVAYLPQKFYLKDVLENANGNHLSIGILYLIIARSLKLPFYGLNLPNNFSIACFDPYSIENNSPQLAGEALFYISPTFKGSIFTRRELDRFLETKNLPALNSYIYPCSFADIINELISGLINYYRKQKDESKINEFSRLLQALF